MRDYIDLFEVVKRLTFALEITNKKKFRERIIELRNKIKEQEESIVEDIVRDLIR